VVDLLIDADDEEALVPALLSALVAAVPGDSIVWTPHPGSADPLSGGPGAGSRGGVRDQRVGGGTAGREDGVRRRMRVAVNGSGSDFTDADLDVAGTLRPRPRPGRTLDRLHRAPAARALVSRREAEVLTLPAHGLTNGALSSERFRYIVETSRTITIGESLCMHIHTDTVDTAPAPRAGAAGRNTKDAGRPSDPSDRPSAAGRSGRAAGGAADRAAGRGEVM
jgi:hypothetical protein